MSLDIGEFTILDMMKTLIKFSIFIFLFYGCGEDGKGTFNIDDDNVHVVYENAYIRESYDDDEKIPITGKVIGYHENGNLKTELIFENGKMNGVQKWWHENGHISCEQNWKNGKENGLFRYWNLKGDITTRSGYKNGMQHGIYKHWHENGKIGSLYNYRNGKLDGLSQDWYDDGQINTILHYQNGEKHGTYRQWYQDGKKMVELQYRNNRRHGKEKYWFGISYMEREYRNGSVINEECWFAYGGTAQERCDCDEIPYLNFSDSKL